MKSVASTLLFFVVIAVITSGSIVKSDFFGKCCNRKTEISFRPKENMSALEASAPNLYKNSNGGRFVPVGSPFTVKVCNDGEPHEGVYCSTASCNIIGCNCDGLCYNNKIGLDATAMFRHKYGHLVDIVD